MCLIDKRKRIGFEKRTASRIRFDLRVGSSTGARAVTETIQTKNNTYVILGTSKNYNSNKKNHISFHYLQYAYMILKNRVNFKNQINQITIIRIDLGLNLYLKKILLFINNFA